MMHEKNSFSFFLKEPRLVLPHHRAFFDLVKIPNKSPKLSSNTKNEKNGTHISLPTTNNNTNVPLPTLGKELALTKKEKKKKERKYKITKQQRRFIHSCKSKDFGASSSTESAIDSRQYTPLLFSQKESQKNPI